MCESEVLLEEMKSISDKCRELLDLNKALLPQEYFYRSLPLCVIDSVFSIGVKYESVQNTVRRYGEAFKLETKRLKQDYPEREDQQSIDDIVRKMDELGIDSFTDSIFKNKQRTSTRNGILKTEAVYRFCKVLEQTLNRAVKINEANELLVAASDLLTLEYPDMTPRLLDYVVWNYSRSQG